MTENTVPILLYSIDRYRFLLKTYSVTKARESHNIKCININIIVMIYVELVKIQQINKYH